jgi:hypothetical protein
MTSGINISDVPTLEELEKRRSEVIAYGLTAGGVTLELTIGDMLDEWKRAKEGDLAEYLGLGKGTKVEIVKEKV